MFEHREYGVTQPVTPLIRDVPAPFRFSHGLAPGFVPTRPRYYHR